MDTRILKHYEAELAYLKDMGAEFANAYPKIASRLDLSSLEVADPYVERLLEGVAFLSARVQLELENQFPKFTSNLFEIIYPHFLAPTPSMMIAKFSPDMSEDGLKSGYVLPRSTEIRTSLIKGIKTPCIFKTSNDVTMWPISVSEVEYIDGRPSLVAADVVKDTSANAAIRIRLSRVDDENISELALDKLSLYLNGQGGAAWQLHEILCTEVVGLVARSTDRRDAWTHYLSDGEVLAQGFSDEEALLPVTKKTFSGYRLLQEYFAMPERFHFVELIGLSDGIKRSKEKDLDIYILLKNGRPDLAPSITVDSFELNAVPAINLFEKRFDRTPIETKNSELQVFPDRTAQLDFEIYSLSTVEGIGKGAEDDIEFKSFYSSNDFTPAGSNDLSFFTQRRVMRQRTEREKLQGVRTGYLGSDLYVMLVDANQAPYGDNLEQLSARGLVTNRDLPLLIPKGASDIFYLSDGGPVDMVGAIVHPNRPKPILAQGDSSWKLISHLSLNYLSITDDNRETGASALRELLGLYVPSGDRAVQQQITGLLSISNRPIVRRINDGVMSTPVKGLELTISFDESYFEGTSVYLIASVLERFFRKFATLNSFTETVLKTTQRGEIKRWKPDLGLGRVI